MLEIAFLLTTSLDQLLNKNSSINVEPGSKEFVRFVKVHLRFFHGGSKYVKYVFKWCLCSY